MPLVQPEVLRSAAGALGIWYWWTRPPYGLAKKGRPGRAWGKEAGGLSFCNAGGCVSRHESDIATALTKETYGTWLHGRVGAKSYLASGVE
jgi:hypothetical protein